MPIPANERARRCDDCGATHRPDVACPPVNRWLISGDPLRVPGGGGAGGRRLRDHRPE